MADVFISYSKTRNELARGLAERLEQAGLSVWWDTGLRPGENFRNEIDDQLNACKATVIIWTPESIKSEWVISEADHAWQQRKLINTHTAELRPHQIPKPFNQAHSVEVTRHDVIIDAVRSLVGPQKREIGSTPLAAASHAQPGGMRPLARSRPILLYGFGVLAAAVVAAVIAWGPFDLAQFRSGPAMPAPKWAFNGDLFIGQPIPFEWTYDRDAAAAKEETPILFEIESASDARFTADRRTDTYADGYHKYMSRINATRFWRVRAIASATRQPISDWSAARGITQYDSAYHRIASTRKLLVSVSNAEIQGAFKWVDDKGLFRGFDFKLAERIKDVLSADLAGPPLKLEPKPVEWTALLDMPRQGSADFIISSITRLERRKRDFNIEFSDPYYCTTHVLIYRVGTADQPIGDMIAGRIVGVQDKTTNARLAEELSKGYTFQLVTFANTETLIDALLRARIDYGVADIPFAISAQLHHRLNDEDLLSFKELKRSDFPPTLPEDEQVENYAIAVRAGEHDLLNVINRVIAAAKEDGSLTRLLVEAMREFEERHGMKRGSSSSYAPSDRPWECAR